jgi:hypothetical protein
MYTASHGPQSRSREAHFRDRARGAKIDRSGRRKGRGVCRKHDPRSTVEAQGNLARLVLRVGRVSVATRRLSAGWEPAGKIQLDRDQLYRTRQVLNRKSFLMSISIRSFPR